MKIVLDAYEQEIEDAIEKGEYVSSPDQKEIKKMFEEAARNYIKKHPLIIDIAFSS